MAQSILVTLTGATVAAEGEGTSTEGHSTSTGTAGETTTHTEVAKEPSNPILPEPFEMASGAIVFVLLWALMKFVLLKPIQQTMSDRADKIRGDLSTAEGAKAQGDAAVAEYEATLASARVEASRIIDDARAQAEAKRKELIGAAEAEVSELRSQAAAEVNAAKADALTSMRASVATIAVQAAEAVVQKRLDEGAQRSIVDEYLNRVGSQN